jgi:hypothetical protein
VRQWLLLSVHLHPCRGLDYLIDQSTTVAAPMHALAFHTRLNKAKTRFGNPPLIGFCDEIDINRKLRSDEAENTVLSNDSEECGTFSAPPAGT